jgi:hypothetical protein
VPSIDFSLMREVVAQHLTVEMLSYGNVTPKKSIKIRENSCKWLQNKKVKASDTLSVLATLK